MSDTDESAVIVEHESAPDEPDLADEEEEETHQNDVAYQIVSVGSEDDAFQFTFDEPKLQEILGRIPADMKVSVVSVVGAFRTGKSFLLSWFLRYLEQQGLEETGSGGDNASTEPWYKQFDSLGNDGFEWKAGSERNTTGIWMWCKPQFCKTASGERLAVLLVDTQGMFDHETTMALTASIFGLSTLLSSYQIYNVDKRIQEDNLQQLALFSEYARTAMARDETKEDEDDDSKDDDQPKATAAIAKPFQQMEFLVRDWQHFDDDDVDDDELDYAAMEQSMEAYLQTVIAERDAKDLQDTREQITSCFEKITCFGLPHPGFAVTKKKYTGDVNAVEEQFLRLLDRYCRRVFSPESLQPKVIHGRALTAMELGTYIRTYAGLFQSGAKFPAAATLLEATAAANNTNAMHSAVSSYKETMDRIAGPHCSNYVRPEELKEEHERATKEMMKTFESIATFGSKGAIKEAKGSVESQVKSSFEVYDSLNKSRNPLLGMETYVPNATC